ncbi:hypothetical protein KP509_01G013500 [Ceratopteris richardii]|uniref:1-phosphatidylinositol 4-kinase n=1 Tax=Ceratopteris richardii TaxID=49495 RepID=A0A8T2VEL3_CERRI|nr:hypothetical protein KP509_01G013500 [Ceratopteris richardii]KAH7445528.1 hypothetical protein KP509_01G013500 [Ceratopteris richardii]KAH7445529.1 hypothetical protein KP509_01G013500 [Ceratopteris richardii]
MPPCVEPSLCPQGQVAGSHEEGNRRPGNITRLVGRRRILVQTDAGNVHVMEIDRDESVHGVKKRLQALLHIPMEQITLVCGNLTLENNLRELKRNGPLMLARNLDRSYSCPCLSPTSESQLATVSRHVLEVIGGFLCSPRMETIIQEISKGIQYGVEPLPISGGLGGAYYFRNIKGERIAIIKPTDEEPLAPNNPKGFVGRALGQYGLKKAVRVGETGVREVAAYLLDHENFAKVPATVLVMITHNIFHVNNPTPAMGKVHSSATKLASCQEFVCHDFDANDHGCSGFSVSDVHRIGILDIRIFNTDRHAGNILVRRAGMPRRWGNSFVHMNDALELIPIDHGLCLPEFIEDPYFEWLHWPQASLAFSDEELEYICRLDGKKDAEMLQTEIPMLRVASLRMLVLCTAFLKKGAAAGLCLAEIGSLMSRDGLEEDSQLEILCLKAREEMKLRCLDGSPDDDLLPSSSYESDDFPEQFDLDEDEEVLEEPAVKKPLYNQHGLSPVDSLGFSGSLHFQRSALIENESILEASTLRIGSSDGYLSWHGKCSTKEAFSSENNHNGRNIEAAFRSNLEGNTLSEGKELHVKQRNSCTHGGGVVVRVASNSESTGNLSSEGACFSAYGGTCGKFKDGAHQTVKAMEPWSISDLTVKAASYKSASLSTHKLRSSFLGKRGACGLSSDETHGKVNKTGTMSAFSLDNMSEEEWISFMDCFEQILEQHLASWHSEAIGYRQRLGMSLPANFQHMRLH